MKINVGDYVRTYYGIRKISKIDEDNNYIIDKPYINKFRQEIYCITDNCIIGNPSPDIIDLVEVGDLAKIEFYSPRYEERITRLFEIEYKDENIIDFRNPHCNLSIYDGNWASEDKELKPIIKEIITREQIEQVSYKAVE